MKPPLWLQVLAFEMSREGVLTYMRNLRKYYSSQSTITIAPTYCCIHRDYVIMLMPVIRICIIALLENIIDAIAERGIVLFEKRSMRNCRRRNEIKSKYFYKIIQWNWCPTMLNKLIYIISIEMIFMKLYLLNSLYYNEIKEAAYCRIMIIRHREMTWPMRKLLEMKQCEHSLTNSPIGMAASLTPNDLP